ncbi:hypothetical protein [Flavobacterium sp. GT3R68]|uniref:hypothetical protein n=1 Tax=Flavobacterium sp. GT3R68 TaxID=2594437 RepID=UPI000F8689F3|nr:hypothetical protein [Flavobacterium sp. GT3R68]RTY95353.1 hypothetical protein EKL32_07945 [Flavobacterium sp. GSN2]TRW90907.1 hypothetical protein FNW07_08725 [Flavobacterium sp. GT3R68]
MKNVKFNSLCIQVSRLFIIPVVLFTFYSCSDSDPKSDVPNEVVSAPYRCLSCKTVSEAKSENDSSFEGIYVGVNPKSSVVVDLMNATDALTAKMRIGGEVVNFSAKDYILDGDTYMAHFDGQYQNEPIAFNFSVLADGSNAKIASDSFPEVFTVVKETSTSMIEVFDGTWTVKDDPTPLEIEAKNIELDTISFEPDAIYVVGRFNMLLARSNGQNAWWRGVNTLNQLITYPSGLIQSNQMFDTENHFIGTLNMDELRGVYVDKNNQKIYLTTRRRI